MARYKIISENGAYLALDPTPVKIELGADSHAARAYNVKAPIFELVGEGAVIEYAGVPGPHMEPLDDEAKTAMAAYLKARPGASLDPTRSLPLGRDPMMVPTFETGMLSMLERMAAEAAGRDAPAPAASDAKLDVLIEQMTKLAGIVAAQATAGAAARK